VKAGRIVASAADGTAVAIGHLPGGLRPGLGQLGVRLCPPPPKDFDPFTATEQDLKRHGPPL
jgi:hypothetical protein